MNLNDLLNLIGITFDTEITSQEVEKKITNLRDKPIQEDQELLKRWVELAPAIRQAVANMTLDNYPSEIDYFVDKFIDNTPNLSPQDIEIIFAHLSNDLLKITKNKGEKFGVNATIKRKKSHYMKGLTTQITNQNFKKALEQEKDLDIPKLMSLLSEGADINTCNKDRMTIIHILAAKDEIAAMEEILNTYKPNLDPENIVAPIFYANSANMILLLVTHGSNLLSTKTPQGQEETTALTYLITKNKITAAELLTAELDKTSIAKENDNGIEKQATEVNFEVLKQLYDRIGEQALSIRGSHSNASLAHMCVQKLNAEFNESTLNAEAINALYDKFTKKWEFQVIRKSNLQLENTDHETPFSLMSTNLKEIHKLSLQMEHLSTNVDELNQQLIAELSKKMAADPVKVRDLITQGASANTRTEECWTAAHFAAAQSNLPDIAVSKSNIPLIELLALKSVDFNLRTGAHNATPKKKSFFSRKKSKINDDEWLPLERAGNIETVIALVKAGANLHEENAQGQSLWSQLRKQNIIRKAHATSLLTAILESEKADEREESIKTLKKFGADVAAAEKRSKKTLPETGLFSKLVSPKKANQLSFDNLIHDINNGAPFFESGKKKTRWDLFFNAKIITHENAAKILVTALDTAPNCDLALIKKVLQTFKTLDINTPGNISGWTAVHAAAHAGDTNYLKELAHLRADINHKTKLSNDGVSPLSLAADINTVKLLLTLGANPSAPDAEISTEEKHLKPLSVLILKKTIKLTDADDILALLLDHTDCDLDLVQELIELGATPNIRGEKSGFSAAHIATIQDKPEFLLMLIQKGAEFTLLPGDKNPPPLSYAKSFATIYALLKGKTDVQWEEINNQSLISLDADISLFDVNDGSANSFQEVIKRANLSPADQSKLLCAVLDLSPPDLATIQALIVAGANPNTYGEMTGLSALHIAAQRGCTELIKILQARSANFDLASTNLHIGPPLFVAKDINTIIALLDGGASYKIQFSGKNFLTHRGIKPEEITKLLKHELGKAAKANLELIEFYLAHGAKLCAKSASGYTVLHIATYQNRTDLIEQWRNRGFNEINFEPSLLSMITETTDINTVNFWVRCGVKLTQPAGFFGEMQLKDLITRQIINESNVTSVLTAVLDAATLDTVAIKHLLELGADPNTQATNGKTIVEASTDALKTLLDDAGNIDLSLIQSLLSLGANVNSQGNRSGRTAAHVAARAEAIELITYLANKGANFNLAINSTGYSPLFVAKDIKTIKALLRGNASLSHEANTWTALRYLTTGAGKKITPQNAKEILTILLDQDNPLDIDSIMQLIELADSNDILRVIGEKSKQTLAHIAAKTNCIDLINLLTKGKEEHNRFGLEMDDDISEQLELNLVDFNAKNKAGYTAISYANTIDTVIALIKAGADISYKAAHGSIFYLLHPGILNDSDNATRILIAIPDAKLDIDILKSLVRCGAQLFDKTDENPPRFINYFDIKLLTQENANALLAIILDQPNYPHAKLVRDHLILTYGANRNTKRATSNQNLPDRSEIDANLSNPNDETRITYTLESDNENDIEIVNIEPQQEEYKVKSQRPNTLTVPKSASRENTEKINPASTHIASAPSNDNAQAKQLMLEKLRHFIDFEVTRLWIPYPKAEKLSNLPKSVGDKIFLYQDARKDINNALEFLRNDIDVNIIDLTKRVAIIAHHRQHRTCDKFVKALSFGIASMEATSWTNFKRFTNFRTQDLTQDKNLTRELRKITYIAKHRELTFFSNREENAKVTVKGYDGYRFHKKFPKEQAPAAPDLHQNGSNLIKS